MAAATLMVPYWPDIAKDHSGQINADIRQCRVRLPFIKLGDGNAASLAGFVKNRLFSGIIKMFYK